MADVVDMGNTASKPAWRYLTLAMVAIGVGSIALGFAGLGKMRSAAREIREQHHGSYVEYAGKRTVRQQVTGWVTMIGCGSGMLILGLTLGGTMGSIAPRGANDPQAEDPDFAGRP